MGPNINLDNTNNKSPEVVSIPSKIVKLLNAEINKMNSEDDIETRFMHSEIIESLITSLDIIAEHKEVVMKIRE